MRRLSSRYSGRGWGARRRSSLEGRADTALLSLSIMGSIYWISGDIVISFTLRTTCSIQSIQYRVVSRNRSSPILLVIAQGALKSPIYDIFGSFLSGVSIVECIDCGAYHQM